MHCYIARCMLYALMEQICTFVAKWNMSRKRSFMYFIGSDKWDLQACDQSHCYVIYVRVFKIYVNYIIFDFDDIIRYYCQNETLFLSKLDIIGIFFVKCNVFTGEANECNIRGILIFKNFWISNWACCQVVPIASLVSELFLFSLYDLPFPCRYFFLDYNNRIW